MALGRHFHWIHSNEESDGISIISNNISQSQMEDFWTALIEQELPDEAATQIISDDTNELFENLGEGKEILLPNTNNLSPRISDLCFQALLF